MAQTEDIRRLTLLLESVRDYAIFFLDVDGRVSSWNVGAERIKGYKAEEIIGRHFSIFYPPEALARGWPDYELQVARAEGRFEDESWRVRKDGTQFWANVVITALFDRDGVHRGFAKITRDLTERRRQEEALRESEERFRLLVDGVQDYAMCMLEVGGAITSWNVGAQRMTGYRADEVFGRGCGLFYPPEDVATGKPARDLALAKDLGHFEEEGWRIRKDGSRFWASAIVVPIQRDGRPYGYALVIRDLTERRRSESLETAARHMEEFLALLAHELRNPLAPIRNAVGVMRVKHLGDPSLDWARDVIDRQVTHLTRLVDDLLDVSRITSGKIHLQPQPVEMVDVLSRSMDSMRSILEGRRLGCELHVPREPVWVEGDPVRMSQVILNLVNNAAKYTPEGGHVWVTLTREGNEMKLSVRDSGIGIPPELIGHVFDLFTQGIQSRDRSEGGLGVGLTLVRRLVEMHGGSVEAKSEGPGRGSEFIVRLPVFRGGGKDDENGRRRASGTAPRRRVLVVDDNRDSAESMRMLLELMGHDVRTAYDGPSALAIAAEQRPELVLLDIGLPGLDGYEVARRMRPLLHGSGVILAAMTGYGQEADRVLAREAGLEHHLVKPVDPVAVEEILSSLPVGPRRRGASD